MFKYLSFYQYFNKHILTLKIWSSDDIFLRVSWPTASPYNCFKSKML